MARKRHPADDDAGQTVTSTAHTTAPASGLSMIGRLLHSSLDAMQQSTDGMVQLQHLCVDTTLSWGESLASELQKLQDAKDPWQLAVTQSEAANQQVDLCAKEIAAAMQQICDSQLLWLGQWDKAVETAETLDTKAAPENFVLATWGKVQDDWLQLSRNWIDSLKPADSEH